MVRIQEYTHQNQAAIHQLILHIQQYEFGIHIELDDQPDLKDIRAFYQKGTGNFWVGLADDVLAGTIGLLDIGNKRYALRKMFVQAAFRGHAHGIGQALLQTAIDWAVAKNGQEILLGTTEKFLAAHRFYEKTGFTAIDKKLLPAEFPAMEVDTRFYRYRL